MDDKTSGITSGPAEIKFKLDLSATLDGGKVSKISFHMNLNPDNKILEIGEYLSSYEGLLAVFKDLGRVLGAVNARTDFYNSIIAIDPKAYEGERFQRGYEENIRPTFGKIDAIDYRHESPGAANVSYARRYNGDIQPPSL